MTNLFTDLGPTWLASDQNRTAATAQSLDQSHDLGALASAFTAFEGDKRPFMHDLRPLPSIIIGCRLAGQGPWQMMLLFAGLALVVLFSH
jgi:hypothetical protein